MSGPEDSAGHFPSLDLCIWIANDNFRKDLDTARIRGKGVNLECASNFTYPFIVCVCVVDLFKQMKNKTLRTVFQIICCCFYLLLIIIAEKE